MTAHAVENATGLRLAEMFWQIDKFCNFVNHRPMQLEQTVKSQPAAAGDDEKRRRVLDGALTVFLAYGFSRTTMDDIARAAALSRPALYLVFRNKTDIYRELARVVLAEVSDKARGALATRGPLLSRLESMVRHAFFDTLKDIEGSPHGAELLDIRNRLAGDLLSDWRAEITQALETVIADDVSARAVDLASRGLSPRDLADVFLDSLEGMKVRSDDPRCHLEFALTSVRVLVAALRP